MDVDVAEIVTGLDPAPIIAKEPPGPLIPNVPAFSVTEPPDATKMFPPPETLLVSWMDCPVPVALMLSEESGLPELPRVPFINTLPFVAASESLPLEVTTSGLFVLGLPTVISAPVV